MLPAIGIVVAPVRFTMNVVDYFPKIELCSRDAVPHHDAGRDPGVDRLCDPRGDDCGAVLRPAQECRPSFIARCSSASCCSWLAAYWLAALLFAKPMFDANSGFAIGKWLVACLIWVPYFLNSASVRNTFVR